MNDTHEHEVAADHEDPFFVNVEVECPECGKSVVVRSHGHDDYEYYDVQPR